MRCDLPGFVSESLSEVVGGTGAIREGRVHYDNTVLLGGIFILPREGGVPQNSVIGTGDGADVEC